MAIRNFLCKGKGSSKIINSGKPQLEFMFTKLMQNLKKQMTKLSTINKYAQ